MDAMNNMFASSSLPPNREGLPMAEPEAIGSEQLAIEMVERDAAYWSPQLSDAPVLNLPTDRLRPPVPGSDFAWRSLQIAKDLNDSLRWLSREEQVPLSASLLSSFYVLLLRYTSQEDMVIGCSSDRDANELGLRLDLSGDPPFRSLLSRVTAALAHGPFSFRRLGQELRAEPGPHNPIFQVSFSYRVSNPEAGSARTLPQAKMVDLHLD